MKAVAVNGISKSGKTTVCEALISGLRRRGYTVGSVKEIHFEAFAIDPDPTTNTRRHRAAGADLVTARGMYETDILYQTKLPMEEIFRHYNHDFLVLEGVSDCNVLSIVTAHSVEAVQDHLDERTAAVSGVVANTGLKEVCGLPVFNILHDPESLVDFVEERAFEPLPSFEQECCGECGYSCRELAGLVVKETARREDCVLWDPEVELYIAGTAVPMVPFVQRLLKNAVLGVAKELRGFRANSTIEVKLRS
ncbi:MAG: molybdopterin-guanine dinucleotide biosynthesis protein MobB [Bacillota bacterium]|nr:molybdopterin-guanine dinucleotide biosynthesis protein MobB [Bacillota bacterium]